MRVGIRWQLASLVLFSSVVGLAVVTIATWVQALCEPAKEHPADIISP